MMSKDLQTDKAVAGEEVSTFAKLVRWCTSTDDLEAGQLAISKHNWKDRLAFPVGFYPHREESCLPSNVTIEQHEMKRKT